jgi:tetrahydromethanopterin S-methyltransferase subunit A
VPAFNVFNEKMDLLNSMEQEELKPVSITTINPEDFVPESWPVQPGDYRVLHPRAVIALLLLGQAPYAELDFAARTDAICLIGRLTTENIGVEHVVKNLISNPFIRHLVISGDEIAGHRPADALIKLKIHGMNKGGRIIEAAGARPVLKNILPAEVEHFRRQITVHDLTGCRDKNMIENTIRSLTQPRPEPFSHGLHVRLVDIIEASPAKRLHLDPAGYFVILADQGKTNPLHVEHYRNNGQLAHIIAGKDAATICSTLLEMKFVSRLDHAAYLGRELAKAEHSLAAGTPYVQDRAQGETC